jgi:hypothetical protein
MNRWFLISYWYINKSKGSGPGMCFFEQEEHPKLSDVKTIAGTDLVTITNVVEFKSKLDWIKIQS